MNECVRIAGQLKYAMEGDAWHGPAVMELLTDIDAEKAGSRSVDNVHTIAELTGHITTWHRAVLRRLNGEVYDPAAYENWPGYEQLNDEQWLALKNDLMESYRKLHKKMELLNGRTLEDMVPGKNYTIYRMLHGVIQHDMYHSGQIAILKKAGNG